MKDKTEEALRGSIEKWHNILHADGEDRGGGDCPLCGEFEETGCKECPVYKKTKAGGCHKTPWENWREHQVWEHHEINWRIHCPTCRELAQAEYDFLKDLLIDYLSTRAKKEWVYECPSCYNVIAPENLPNQWADMLRCPKCQRESIWRDWGGIEYDYDRGKLKKPRVEKKKEEWEDITKEIRWVPYQFHIGSYWLDGIYQDRIIVYCSGNDMFISTHLEEKYRIEFGEPIMEQEKKGAFRILKRKERDKGGTYINS